MSILASSLLTGIVAQGQVLQIDRILEKLHRRVQNVLSQGDTANKDGLDISLLYVDKENSTIEFTGAKGEMILVRKENELIRVKGDRLGIGGVRKNIKSVFEKQVFKYTKGDRVYMYSDGYQDQFGGPIDRKFMNKRVRELINQHRDTPIKEQEDTFLQTLENWKGSSRQIDDILVLGIEF